MGSWKKNNKRKNKTKNKKIKKKVILKNKKNGFKKAENINLDFDNESEIVPTIGEFIEDLDLEPNQNDFNDIEKKLTYYDNI
jgi:hypothetical protein